MQRGRRADGLDLEHGAVAAALRAALEQAGIKHAPDIADRAIRRHRPIRANLERDVPNGGRSHASARRQEAGVMTRRLRCLERGREQPRCGVGRLGGRRRCRRSARARRYLCAARSRKVVPRRTWPIFPLCRPPELRARVLGSERIVAQAQALVDVGKVTKAEELTKRGIAEARAIPYARTEAALLLIEGASKQRRGDKDGGHRRLSASFRCGPARCR